MSKPRQRRRAEARGVKLDRDPSAGDLLAAHMFRLDILHVEFSRAEVETALNGALGNGYRITVDGRDQEAPALLALHMRAMGTPRVEFTNDELNDLTPGHKTIIDGDDEQLRITLVPTEIADMAADLPTFREKARGESKKRRRRKL